ncbi:CHAT domain-containing protein [Streptomyces sp. NPDC046831]|uniref:CHAT domain-containing protein n=1 Tax=Streptomyces sp. NPDC046831 TaxID=3154805 RepID=UPI0034088D9A
MTTPPDPRQLAVVASFVRRFRAGAAGVARPDDEVREAARILAAAHPLPPDVAQLLGWYHWACYRAVPPNPAGNADLDSALSCFEAAGEAVLSDGGLPALVRDHLLASRRSQPSTDPPLDVRVQAIDHLLHGAAARGDAGMARQAVRLAKQCLDGLGETQPGRAEILIRVSLACAWMFRAGGGREAVDQAVAEARNAVSAAPEDVLLRRKASLALASALEQRFDEFRTMGDLSEAIAICRGHAKSPEGDLVGRSHRSLLAECLQLKYETTADERDVGEAKEHLEHLLATDGSDGASHAMYRSSLAALHLAQYERTGAVEHLNESTTHSRRALAAAEPAQPERTEMLERLSLALQARFERTGDPETLDEAIDVGEKAVRLSRPGERRHTRYLYGLLMALRLRHDLAGDPRDLDRAIALGRTAQELGSAGNQTALLAHQLGIALRRRHERRHDGDDLDEALRLARLACDETQGTPRGKAAALNSLAHGLRVREPDTAAHTYERALELLGPADPARAAALVGLGEVRQRTGRDGGPAFRKAANITAATTSIRLRAAQHWRDASIAHRDWPDALDAAATAVELLPRLAGIELLRKDQEEELAAQSGLASTAAAVALQAGDVGAAAMMLEQGRGVLLSRALDARTDLTALRERDEGLAAEFAALCRALDTGGREHWSGTGTDLADHRHHLAGAWDQILERIREVPGFRDFLKPLSLEKITAAAVHGPIAMVNVHHIRSDALVVKPEGIRHVSLPRLTPESVRQWVTALLASGDEDREQRLLGMLGWLWDTVAGPVLEAAGIVAAAVPEGSATDPVSRLWWCPTGLLSLLPLHAAGHHRTRSDAVPMTVMDRTVSSYTPTIRALLHARRPAAQGQPSWAGRVFAVVMPRTPAEANIPGARREARLLTERFGTRAEIREGAENLHAAVLSALPRFPWAHFSCHGVSDAQSPSRSRLLLYDHSERPFTVTDVARLRLGHAELAFLSACSTARSGTALADEAIQLVSAFQLAGYRHAIGTLWEIGDGSAVRIATDVYTALAPDARNAALALHKALLRRRTNAENTPSVWAAHLHSGA